MTKLAAPKVRVLLEQDGTDDLIEYDVQTDNREMIGWDITRAKKQWPETKEAPLLWATYAAWHALRRVGEIPPAVTLDKFLDTCVEVKILGEDGEPITDAEAMDAAGVDPTRTDLESV